MVCKSCWAAADVDKKETIKQHMDGFCTVLGCWEYAEENCDGCSHHKNVKAEDIKIEELFIRKNDHDRALAEPVDHGEHRQRSRSPARGSNDDAPANPSLYALRHMQTSVLTQHVMDCVRELELRASQK